MAFKHLSVQELSDWINRADSLNIIDIRDQQSYLAGHINDAEHIHNDNVQSFVDQTDRTTPLIVCCYHGNSSQGAADYFSQQGFTDCYSLDGGYEAWRALLNSTPNT